MGFVVPFINQDTSLIRNKLNEKLKQEHIQKRLVLTIVCVALLLDNMLYMVIVPIMPSYLKRIKVFETKLVFSYIDYKNGTVENFTKIEYVGEKEMLGYLFAIKAIVQLCVNPFSGTLIDRIGYEMPLIFGLVVLFTSTAIFALGRNYPLLFFARSLQGLGSAFADPSGLAMIADRFTEDRERNKAMGVALAFISFGSLVAPPFGGILYKYSGFNHAAPFMILSLICLLDGLAVFTVIQPRSRAIDLNDNGDNEKPKGTPIWRLFLDPYIAVCAGALVMANVSLAFLEPTISDWMWEKMGAGEDVQGLIWLPAFLPHVAGVFLTVVILNRYPQYPWLISCLGLLLEGFSCLLVPFAPNYVSLVLPLCTICFGVALIDTALLPTLGHLVDTRHVSVYGSVYALADISYCLAYAFGPMIAGQVMSKWGFIALNVGIFFSNIFYAPLLCLLKKVYTYKQFVDNQEVENVELTAATPKVDLISSSAAIEDIINNVNNSSYNYYGSLSNEQQQAERPKSFIGALFHGKSKVPDKTYRKDFKDTDRILQDDNSD